LFSMNISADTVPNKPTNLAAVSGNNLVFLTWTAPSNNSGSVVDGYLIYRGESPTTMEFYKEISASPLSYQDTSVINGHTYYYSITAHNSMGESDFCTPYVNVTPFGVPFVPTSAKATVGLGQTVLSWNAPYNDGGTPIINYRVYRGTSSSLILFLSNTTSTTLTDTDLSDGQTYYYRVSAVNKIGEGPSCDVFYGTLASAPGPLVNLQTVASNSTVTLTWTAPIDNGGSSITGYIVYRSFNSGGETVFASVNGTTYKDIGLVNGVRYYYRVSAVNAVGEGQKSSEVSATPMAVLAPPNSITVSPSDSSILLSWNPPANTGGSNVSSYRIYRGTSEGTLLFLASVTNTSYQDTGLTNGEMYYYKISTVNSVNEGTQSPLVSTIPFTYPSVPLSLNAVAGDGNVSLSWSAPSSNGGSALLCYHIYWSESRTGPWTMIDTLNTDLVYNQTGLTNDDTYYYQVAAVNAAGEGPRTTPLAVPFSPTIVSAIAGVSTVKLIWTVPAWDNGSDAVSYVLFRGTSSGTETPLRSIAGGQPFTDDTASPGTAYYYYITTENAKGHQFTSNEAVATPFTYPDAPTSLDARGGVKSVTLNWSAPAFDGYSPILGYHIFRGLTSGDLSQVATTTDLGYLDTGLISGTTYYYHITAFNAAGDGNATSEVSATTLKIDPPIGLLATAGDGNITLQWNPPAGVNVFTYCIYRGNDSGGEVILTNYPGTSWVDNNITSGQTYYYKVSVLTTQGEESQMSEEASATPAVSQSSSAPESSLFDQMWFRVAMIMTILVVGFFSFVIFVRKGTVQVRRDR
jgi:fibronectin type 3 domain-containing protein